MSKILYDSSGNAVSVNELTSLDDVTITITDSEGDIVDPFAISTLQWTLVDTDGTVINSRHDVAMATTSNPVTLDDVYGDDLQMLSGEDMIGKRFLLVECTYEKSAGETREISEEFYFVVNRLYGKIPD
jgi:hypothetical protein